MAETDPSPTPPHQGSLHTAMGTRTSTVTGPYSAQNAPAEVLRESFSRRNYYHIVSTAEILIDFVTVFSSFLFARPAFEILGRGLSEALNPQRLNQVVLLQVAAVSGLTVLVFWIMGLYTKDSSLLNIDEMRKLFRSVILIAVLFFTASFYFRIPFSRSLITLWLGFILFFMIIEKMVFYKIHQYLHIKGLNVKNVLVYGAGEIGRKLHKRFITFPKLGYHPVGFVDDDFEFFSNELKRVGRNGKEALPFLGTLKELERLVEEFKVVELFIARKGLSPEKVLEMTNRCREMHIQFKIIPQLFGYFIENLTLQDIAGIPLIGEKVPLIRRFDLLVKRTMDIVLSLAICAFCLPIFVLIAITIKFDSSGPVIFRQTRVGKNGREFMIYKFRTMFAGAPKYDYCPQDSSDARITRVGKYLRKTSLDELPQFFNVLRGNMSIVGPRPEMSFIVAGYNPLHRKRLWMKPGITGLWQISSDRTAEILENMDYDLYYVDNFSILLDVAILVRTLLYGLITMKTA